MILGFHFAMGGGQGDIWFDLLEDPRLKLLPGLVEDYNYRIRAYFVCHCPGAEDLVRYHPHIHEAITEPWVAPNECDPMRFNRQIDRYVPLRQDMILRYAGPVVRQAPFEFRYTPEERAWADEMLSQRPVITLQPYAGLSDRDGFDPERLGLLCQLLVELEPNCRVLVLGKNHERGHKYAFEELHFDHPRVVNLIDQLGMRMSLLLVSQCDAFGGCHSNLIRAAWRWRRRNVCVMPTPLMTDALPQLDRKYLFGFNYPETLVKTYRFAHGEPRQFETLDLTGIARHLLGR